MIYNEIVHLDTDNQILIEVLDGRTVRLTFDANPLEVLYEKRKIKGIKIGGVDYLLLNTFTNVFVTINDKLHTYDITEIDKVNDNCFQAHTMPRTKSSFFITPMLGKSRDLFRWGQYFVNTFLTKDDKAVLLYRFFNESDYLEYEHSLKKHALFEEMIDYDIQHTAFKFRIPAVYLEDLKNFKEGKYSQMSNPYKEQILKFHGLQKDSTLGKILFKSDDRRKQMELELGVSIPPDVELYDLPGEFEYFKKKEELVGEKI